jgi:ABC-type polysaccharide transport system, permease component
LSNTAATLDTKQNIKQNKKLGFFKKLIKDRWLYIMLLPGVVFFLVFKYGPMLGLVMAFQNYQPFLGFAKSPWVGFKHFQRFFSEPAFFQLLRNTIMLALYNILFYFPLPIIISLLLNEIKRNWFKRSVQTLIYVPHFLSWVVIYSLTYTMFNGDSGVINNIIGSFGGDKINFLASEVWFRPMITGQIIWKDTGWGTIIFLAALTGVNPELYEAAEIDGANRWHQLLNITIPSIKSTIITLLILRMGHVLNSGFEQIFLMINPLNKNVGDVFDTYVYTMGISNGQLSYTAAVGMFKSVASLFLIVLANNVAKKMGEEGIY